MFSEKLVELRSGAGLSQGALAAKIGLSRQAIGYLETAENEPSWETVQKLAKAFGVSTEVFADPGITLPDAPLPGPPGRPRKEDPAPSPPKPKGKKK